MDAAVRRSGPCRERGWDINEYELEAAARQASPIFNRAGVLREARRAIARAKLKVQPLGAATTKTTLAVEPAIDQGARI